MIEVAVGLGFFAILAIYVVATTDIEDKVWAITKKYSAIAWDFTRHFYCDAKIVYQNNKRIKDEAKQAEREKKAKREAHTEKYGTGLLGKRTPDQRNAMLNEYLRQARQLKKVVEKSQAGCAGSPAIVTIEDPRKGSNPNPPRGRRPTPPPSPPRPGGNLYAHPPPKPSPPSNEQIGGQWNFETLKHEPDFHMAYDGSQVHTVTESQPSEMMQRWMEAEIQKRVNAQAEDLAKMFNLKSPPKRVGRGKRTSSSGPR